MKVLLTTLHSKYIHASLALPYLKAFCNEECPDIHIHEYSVHEPKEVVLAHILSFQPDVVCFSVYIWNRLASLELVNCIKLINPDILIVLGGPEVSFEQPAFFKRYAVDCIVQGEGELPLRHLLTSWQRKEPLQPFPGLQWAATEPLPGNSCLETLDEIPSPFQQGLVDLNKGLVYYESSRGCPYSCSFCMSSLDDRVRSFSLARIKADLLILMNARVKLIKFVDRTFNYKNSRSREIFSFILKYNTASQFHFEIGAHLIDDETMELLKTVPPDLFQFEIGVQSTLPATLSKVCRQSSMDRLGENVRRLKAYTQVHLHLDLIAGLPDETYDQFLGSLDKTMALGADHLQIEPVKLLPGAPLRQQAAEWGICFDPHPPYTILKSAAMSFDDLERLRGIGRLLDLLVNSGRFSRTIAYLEGFYGKISSVLEHLDAFWRVEDLYSRSHALKNLYFDLDRFLASVLPDSTVAVGRECLARDYAMNERLMAGNAPSFFDLDMTEEETAEIRQQVKKEVDKLPRTGKVQYCAAAFHHLEENKGRTILLYLYFTQSGAGMQVREIELPSKQSGKNVSDVQFPVQ